MPLSTSVMVNRDEVLDLLDETIERLPDELRAARWLLKEREEYLAKVKREGEDILDQARTRAERMVQRTEVVKASEARARKIVDAATDEAARLKNEVEDFCDQKLGQLRDRPRAHHEDGRRRPSEAPGLAQHRRGARASVPAYDDEPGRPGGVRPGPRVVAPMAQPILRIGVMELRRRPGTQRDVRVATALPGLAITGRTGARRCRARGGRHARVDRRAPSPCVGTVRGALGRRSAGAASTRSTGLVDVEVREVFEVRPIDGETYPIEGDEVDLEPVVRDAALLNLPLAALCRPDCAGPGPETLPVDRGGRGVRASADAGPPLGGARRAAARPD